MVNEWLYAVLVLAEGELEPIGEVLFSEADGGTVCTVQMPLTTGPHTAIIALVMALHGTLTHYKEVGFLPPGCEDKLPALMEMLVAVDKDLGEMMNAGAE